MQKKILPALFIIISLVTNVDAQIKKGAVLLGGQLGISAGNTNNSQANPPFANTKDRSLNVSPAFGKAVKDNLVVGADLVFSYNKSENTYSQFQKSNAYGLGFFVRKYKNLGKDFYLFVQGRAGGNYYKQEFNNQQQGIYPGTIKGYNIQLAVYPGIAYSLSKKFQLEAGLNNLAYAEFNHNKQSGGSLVTSTTVGNNFSLGTSLSNFSGLTIGFRVLLN